MMDTLQVLKERELTLMPFDPHDGSHELKYFCNLVSKYEFNTIESQEKIIDIIDRYSKYLWLVELNGVRAGSIFLMYFPAQDEWTLDAYADMQVGREINKHGDYSYRAGKLVVDYFFQNHKSPFLYTRHDVRNRAATRLCKKIGFKDVGSIFLEGIGKHIVMSLSKDLWELRRKFNGN